jgi:VanZ family protein
MKKNKASSQIINFLYFFLPIVVWMLVIFTFSSKPTGVASTVDWQDFAIKKFAHIVVYGVLSVFVYRGLRAYGVSRRTAFVVAVLFSVVYGTTDEYHQSFIAGRTPKVRDVGFDTIGATLSLLILWFTSRKMPKKLMSLAAALDIVW